MSEARKSKDAAKPAKTPGPPPKGKTPSAKPVKTAGSPPRAMGKAKAPAKQPKTQPLATPVHEAFAETGKDAELFIVGAEKHPGAARKFEKGERFVVPIWSVKLLEELATVALGQRLAKDNAVVHDAQHALLMAAIPAYIARARVENNRLAPANGPDLDPELYKAACASVARVLEQGFFDEAQTLTRALRRLEAIDETWNDQNFGNKRVLRAVALRIDLATRGKTPTKQVLREAIYGDQVAESQVSREFKRITGLTNLPRAKTGPKPGSTRGAVR